MARTSGGNKSPPGEPARRTQYHAGSVQAEGAGSGAGWELAAIAGQFVYGPHALPGQSALSPLQRLPMFGPEMHTPAAQSLPGSQ